MTGPKATSRTPAVVDRLRNFYIASIVSTRRLAGVGPEFGSIADRDDGIRFAICGAMFSSETVEWIVCRGEADVKCTRRDTDRGIELSVTFRGLLVARCVASTMTHAANWAANRLDSWRAAGYEVLRSTPERGDLALTR